MVVLPRARAKPRPRAVFLFLRERNRGGGKVENLLLVFHFSIRLRGRSCGNVEISPALGEISKGLVERVGSGLWLSTLSTARHFHSSVVYSFSPRPRGCWELLLVGVFLPLAVLQPVTLPVHLQDVD